MKCPFQSVKSGGIILEGDANKCFVLWVLQAIKLSTHEYTQWIGIILVEVCRKYHEARAIALNDLEAAVLVTPPDPNWPCGIVSVQVHEIRDLNIKMEGRKTTILGSRKDEGEKGQDDQGEEQEEGEHLPSSYCTM